MKQSRNCQFCGDFPFEGRRPDARMRGRIQPHRTAEDRVGRHQACEIICSHSDFSPDFSTLVEIDQKARGCLIKQLFLAWPVILIVGEDIEGSGHAPERASCSTWQGDVVAGVGGHNVDRRRIDGADRKTITALAECPPPPMPRKGPAACDGLKP
jgi:hypothetical protein